MGNLLDLRVLHVRFAPTAVAVAVLLLAGAPLSARAQPACVVLDTELQGAYEGRCAGGKAEGRGTAKGSATYTGEFHLGMKQGRGVKTWPWGDRYEGEFVEDYKEGWGVYTWGARTLFAGDRYEGGFARDRRNGFGLYTWASGDSYAGPWKDDAVTGLASPMMIARFRATNAAMEGLAKPGTKVCHESSIGVGASSASQAETQEVSMSTRQVRVKITKIGGSLVVAGVPLAVGDVVWDDPLDWIPCN
jgi:hypothetical protein